MPWLQITCIVPRGEAENLSDALEAAGALAVTVESAGEDELLQAAIENMPLWDRNAVTAMFPEFADAGAIVDELRNAGIPLAGEPKVGLLPDEDWAQSWKARYRPVHVAGELWIVPSWLEPPDPHAANLMLDPGMAFGTGEHPTTAQCLEWLVGNPPQGLDLVDYGCGSGILAIAAIKLGAARATAVDIDAQALEVARENAERNNVHDRITFSLPEKGVGTLSHREANKGADPLFAPLVIANILAKPLIELAPVIGAMVAPQGTLLLSGMLDSQADEVARAYAGFEFTRRSRAGWSLLIGRASAPGLSSQTLFAQE
jgi:ribosomal protein L11 methyltransferase